MLIASRRATIVAVGAAAATTAALLTAPAAAATRFSPGSPGAGDPYFPLQGNGGYDVRHYGVWLDFAPRTHRIVATTRITAVATQNLSRFDLDLRRLTVDGVRVDGRRASFTRHGQELVVTPARGLPAGHRFTVRVRYHGVPHLVVDPDGSIEGWVATPDGAVVVGEPQGTPSWLPCNDTPNDKATFDFSVRVPAGLTVLANGELRGRRTARGHTTWRWHEGRPMSTYLATVTSGRFVTRTGVSRSGIPYVIASDPTLAKESLPVLAKTPRIVDFFQSVYGRYPWASAGGIVDNAPNVGYSLETTTKPVYAYAPDELTVAHELAHQWFGDSVTLHRWRDIWLNEGFAEFSSWLWSEHTGGRTAAQFFKHYYALPVSSGIWDPPPANPGGAPNIFAGSVYERGAMTLEALRQKLGDRTFFRLLRRWAALRQYANATVPQFVALAEHVSGRDLTRFFRVWLYYPAKPTRW